MVLSLALALVGAAAVARSTAALRLARHDLVRTQNAAALDGAHLQAAAAIVRDGADGPYHWYIGLDLGQVEVTAEPESDKLTLAAAAALDDGVFRALGVAQPPVLKARLAAASEGQTAVSVGLLDPAPLWRECGPALTSSYASQTSFAPAARRTPDAGLRPPAWRVGETWRIQIASLQGWRDDRIVRFTGDAQQPAATVWRLFSRDKRGGVECDEILKSALAG
jgi:hypothetical protein